MVIHNLFFISVICTLPSTALESEASKQSQSENNAICDVVHTQEKKVNFSPGLLQCLKRFEFANKSEV